MKKLIVSVSWIVLLNGTFTGLYVAYILNFNPTATHAEVYEFGNSYGGHFFLFSVALVWYLAASNRLPGARLRTSS